MIGGDGLARMMAIVVQIEEVPVVVEEVAIADDSEEVDWFGDFDWE
ncbi:MAG: hypothetical protein ACRC62_15385 [Microcoleus sp.]